MLGHHQWIYDKQLIDAKDRGGAAGRFRFNHVFLSIFDAPGGLSGR